MACLTNALMLTGNGDSATAIAKRIRAG